MYNIKKRNRARLFICLLFEVEISVSVTIRAQYCIFFNSTHVFQKDMDNILRYHLFKLKITA